MIWMNVQVRLLPAALLATDNRGRRKPCKVDELK
jgi:hypothetical protein